MGAPTKEQRRSMLVIIGGGILGLGIIAGLLLWGTCAALEYISEVVR